MRRHHAGRPPGRIAGALGAAFALSCVFLLGNSDRIAGTLIFLPGTQPGTADTLAEGGVSACAPCHSAAPGREIRIQGEWAGSMMAHAARDPVFYAALAVANKYSAVTGENTGEYCIRCHSPTGWLAARSEDVTGASLRGTDMDGVQCDYCHRVVDPLDPDSTVPPTLFPVPGYGNGMHVVQAAGSPKRGPRFDPAAPHGAVPDSFQSSASLCGICHDVSNPFHTAGQDRITLPPHEYSPLERTYSEWLLSAFSSEGPAGTCQGCHMGPAAGYAASSPSAPWRPDVRAHDLTGGNTFVPRILGAFWEGLDTALLARGAERARATLGRAAEVSGTAVRTPGGVTASVRVTNLTGHKLPTGYPEGRRMWLSIAATDSAGDTLRLSGAYDPDAADLVPDSGARVYEAVHGLSDAAAARYGLSPGPSFHFSLNDTVLFDNRIPPRGFTNAGFAQRRAGPVGASYADGVHWDDAVYELPAGTARIAAVLRYQSVSRPYVTFLRDENAGNVFDWNSWGEKLYAAWEGGGKSAPETIDSIVIAVGDTVSAAEAGAGGVPPGYRLDPPFPNPFNGSVAVRFALPSGGRVIIDLVDVAGRTVALIADGRYGPGERTVSLTAPSLPTGLYLVRMRAGPFSKTGKILLIR
jgi:hypothetical protein